MDQENQETNISIGDSVLHFIKGVFSLTPNVDKQRAREEIVANINFKGMPAYVLVASIIVASIGLNANSVAVVIGAMLISPLMGPIIGLGYSVAVNDWETLRKSLINFAIMVVIALITSTTYFLLVPLKSLTEQLQGRIEPTSLDVMIAFFGGFAGIAALCSKIKNANVIAGVAIATALMPPLCTAGYGLAMGSQEVGYRDYTGFAVFFNALYLFFINSIFIAISTYIFIKVTRFPLAKYQNAIQARRTNYLILGIALLTMIPSSFIFYNIIKEELFNTKLQSFLKNEVESVYENTFFNLNNPMVTQKDTIKYVTISTLTDRIPEEVVENWNKILDSKYKLHDTRLVVYQGTGYDNSALQRDGQEFVRSLYKSTGIEIQKKDSTIASLKNQVARLNSDTIPFQSISSELKSQYPEINHFGYGVFNYQDYSAGRGKNIIPTFILTWKNEPTTPEASKDRKEDIERINKYLKIRLKLDTIQYLKE
ncbi:DUF389 domain-containing protein [Flavobacteriaceae bacterium Ap0902]|nr:DUF389 domain-containing protein [Flavobacteriaceae bacterium Ap0902]